MVQWLLHDAGAKPNPIDRFGRTPLEDAVCLLVIDQSMTLAQTLMLQYLSMSRVASGTL